MTPILGIIASSRLGAPSTSFESIATATGTGSNATITFSSIPATYKHLQLRWLCRDTSGGIIPNNIRVEFNSDTGSNYTRHFLTGDGSAASATGQTAATVAGAPEIPKSTATGGMNANIFGAGILDILDYASTTKNKTMKALVGIDYNTANTNAQVNLFSSVWLSTSAVSTIKVYLANNSNFATGTSFALYGIKG